MLYVNAYLVAQVYGGREEGGWYYSVGTPLAAIPIETQYQPGISYYISDGKVVTRQCEYCDGTGKVEEEVEEEDKTGDSPITYMKQCDCGDIPSNIPEAESLMAKLQEQFKDEAGRYEEIRVALEQNFAYPFPDRKPTYE